MRTPFLGTAYASRSLNLADQQLINLFPEMVETKSGKDVGMFLMCPGLDLLGTFGSGPIRGARAIGSTLYLVSGNTVYSTTSAAWAATSLGTISTASGPVSMIDNGSQVVFFDGSAGYLISGGVLSTLSLPFTGPGTAAYQDGFGIVNQVGTSTWYQSNLGDLSTWSALNFSAADSQPDNLIAIADIHREVWLFKQYDIEVWINAGLSGFAFQRLQGVFLELGCAAAASVVMAGEQLIWLARDRQGQATVVSAAGYKERRISTHAIERAIQSYSVVSDAIAYAYQQEGHLFYVLTFPTGNATWVYDVTASGLTGFPVWHQRAEFIGGQYNRHWGNAYVSFAGRNIVGDYRTGKLYAFNLDTNTDAGAVRKWLRSWRALPKPSDQPTRFSSLRIDMETGMGVADGAAPQCVLRWSDDGGHRWSAPRIQAVGPTGATAQRVKFNRLGSTRRNTGLDRIFELSSTDAFKVALIGAELE